jgi:hypothetical protein
VGDDDRRTRTQSITEGSGGGGVMTTVKSEVPELLDEQRSILERKIVKRRTLLIKDR